MSKEKVKELIVCVVALLVLGLVLTTNVFAEEDITALSGNQNKYNTIDDEDEDDWDDDDDDLPTIKNNTVNNTVNNTANNSKNNAANNSKNNSKNSTSIPYTGLDNSILFIIAVCGISTIYAYKKIRDYNNV